MSKLFFCGILLALSFEVSQAQPKAPEKLFGGDEPAKFHKNIFVEGFGNGLLVSVNYDMRLKKGVQDGLGIRVGLGGGNIDRSFDSDYLDASIVSIPLGVNYLVGKRRSAFEAGLGITPMYYNAKLAVIDGDVYTNEKGWGAIGVMNLGYRFQPMRNGLVFRVDWSPIISAQGFEGRFWGVSLGFGFK